MAVNHSSSPHKVRNVFISGLVIGVVLTLIFSALLPKSNVAGAELEKINQRLDSIEGKMATPTPAPAAASSPAPGTGSVTISQINKDPKAYMGQTVTVSGKVNSPYQGVGFVLVDADGTFVWVHTKGQIPNGNATVKGKVTELKDQLAQWKNEPGWPDNDSTLTAKLRDEKVFIEAENVQ